MAGWQVNPFVLPDFGASAIEGRQAQQAQQQNALLMAARQREYENSVKYENALQRPEVLQGMTSADPAARQAAYSILAQQGGVQGFQAALPMINQERQQAGLQQAMSSVFGGGAPVPMPQQGAPQGQPSAMPQVPGNLAPILQRASAESGVPVPLILATLKQESSMGQDPRANANGGGPMQIISSTARDPGYGLPPLSDADRLNPEIAIPWAARYLAARGKAAGVTDWSDPAQRARGFTAYNGGGDPNYAQNVERRMTGGEAGGGGDGQPGRPQMGGRIPTTTQLFALMATGNPQAMELASKLAPLVAQANPNMVKVEQGGRVFMVNPQDPSQRIDLGAQNDVRPETRNGVRGQVVNGEFKPINDPAPAGYRTRTDGTQEAVPGGPAVNQNQQQEFGNTSKLREEFTNTQASKDFSILRPRIEAIRKAEKVDTRAADMDIVYAYANMLDPGSVVREGEALTLSRTGGPADATLGWINSLNGGARLTPEVRAKILNQAESRFTIAADAYDDRLNYYQGVARDNGFKPEHIGRQAAGRKAEAAPAASAPAIAPPGAVATMRWNPATQKLEPVR